MKIFLFGINGKMGKMICERVKSFEGVSVAGGFDTNISCGEYPVFNDINAVNVDFDVIIDFSRPEALKGVADLSKKRNIPVVLATTGYNDEDLKIIDELAKSAAVFKSGNMSLGVNVIIELVERAAQILFETFDVEIIEKHHNQKIDAPSGTAAMLLDAVNKAAKETVNPVYGRYGRDAKRKKGDIGIHAVRGGTVVGEHDVIFCGADETVTISHTALSRKIFADGAIKAAGFIIDKAPGLYNMKDLLG